MQIFLAITFIGLVVLAISALGGHHEFGGHEISFDHGHDIGHDAHGDTEGSPSFLSTRILSLFAVAFDAHHRAYPMFWYRETLGRFGDKRSERIDK